MYVVGIDLGTTNCTMAYSLLGQSDPSIEQFPIVQTISSNTVSHASTLPSFIYFPMKEEITSQTTSLPWDTKNELSIGLFARNRSAEIPSRSIASAKSWLCHSGINRRKKILPYVPGEERLSPLEACAELLRHMKSAWGYAKPEISFEKQQILVTVPASFDPSARQLVQEAAILAGYPEIILLEEPQAAFYGWLHRHTEQWRKQLKEGDTILVIDIGGGTTDFSLISVSNEEGNLSLVRQAVGSHLLLGGDNIDLALAYLAKGKLEAEGHIIDDWQFQMLIPCCRQAKEQLLSDQQKEKADLTIMGRGSRLIGGTLTTSLSRQEMMTLVIDGFFPFNDPQQRSSSEKRSGLQQIGLPYAQDPRISYQMAKFLSMTGEVDSDSMEKFVLPTAVLFNGGTLKAASVRNRLMELLNRWASQMGKSPVRELKDPDFDHAVSQGAAYYGFARANKGLRIKSGTSHSYYVGVEEAIPAVPGLAVPLKAICMVPFGMEEGSELWLSDQEFALVLGEQATFRFFSCSTRCLSDGLEPKVGMIVKNWKQLLELHPIETRLERSEQDGKTVKVKLKSRVTELGVLELWCVAEDGRSWKLEFDLR